jgi:hypothetical protein
MDDRAPFRGGFLHGVPIQIVFEDGFDGSIGMGANVNGVSRSGFQAFRAKWFGKAKDAKTSTEALFGMALVLQD